MEILVLVDWDASNNCWFHKASLVELHLGWSNMKLMRRIHSTTQAISSVWGCWRALESHWKLSVAHSSPTDWSSEVLQWMPVTVSITSLRKTKFQGCRGRWNSWWRSSRRMTIKDPTLSARIPCNPLTTKSQCVRYIGRFDGRFLDEWRRLKTISQENDDYLTENYSLKIVHLPLMDTQWTMQTLCRGLQADVHWRQSTCAEGEGHQRKGATSSAVRFH